MLFSNIPNFIKGFYYTVQENDTIEIISKRYKVRANNIILVNKLTYPYTIKEGKKIFIPGRDEPIAPEGTSVYTVKFGDSIGSISKKFNVSAEELMKKNYLTNKNTLFIDQKLLLPNKAAEYIETEIKNVTSDDNGNDQIKIYPISDLGKKDKTNKINMASLNSKLSNVKKGDRSTDVVKLKRLISAIGYNVKKFDNYFDSNLEHEIKRLQREIGIVENGVVDMNVWEYLFDYINNMSI